MSSVDKLCMDLIADQAYMDPHEVIKTGLEIAAQLAAVAEATVGLAEAASASKAAAEREYNQALKESVDQFQKERTVDRHRAEAELVSADARETADHAAEMMKANKTMKDVHQSILQWFSTVNATSRMLNEIVLTEGKPKR